MEDDFDNAKSQWNTIDYYTEVLQPQLDYEEAEKSSETKLYEKTKRKIGLEYADSTIVQREWRLYTEKLNKLEQSFNEQKEKLKQEFDVATIIPLDIYNKGMQCAKDVYNNSSK